MVAEVAFTIEGFPTFVPTKYTILGFIIDCFTNNNNFSTIYTQRIKRTLIDSGFIKNNKARIVLQQTNTILR